jgi:transcriptional regulator with XRE-family HTH domain
MALGMTPEQFTVALARLGWKQSDLCRKAGLDQKTPSRWATGAVPIPGWVAAYLGVLGDLKAMHTKYLDPKGGSAEE